MNKLKQHPIYTDYYGSESGNVYSKKFKSGRIRELKPIRLSTGYYILGLCFNKQRIQILQHKFIADIFVPNPNNYTEINHIDFDKSNNSASNLEWCSREYNMRHYFEKNYDRYSKVKYLVENLNTNEKFEITNLTKFCREHKIDRASVYNILKGTRIQTKGFKFYSIN
jgi:hypothetical protein